MEMSSCVNPYSFVSIYFPKFNFKILSFDPKPNFGNSRDLFLTYKIRTIQELVSYPFFLLNIKQCLQLLLPTPLQWPILVILVFKSYFSNTLLTWIIDHLIPPSCSSDLPCSRKTEPNDPFACKDCLRRIHDGPPNSSWDIPPDAPSLHTLPGKSLFTLYLCRLKIFIL